MSDDIYKDRLPEDNKTWDDEKARFEGYNHSSVSRRELEMLRQIYCNDNWMSESSLCVSFGTGELQSMVDRDYIVRPKSFNVIYVLTPKGESCVLYLRKKEAYHND